MKSNLLVTVLVLILIIAGIGFLVSRNDAAPAEEAVEAIEDGEAIFVTTNPDGFVQDTTVAVETDGLMSTPYVTGLEGQGSIQSAYAHDGRVYVSVDGTEPQTGGVIVLDDTDDDDARTFASASRMIMGAATLLNAPKGIEVSDDLDMIIVSDQGSGDIKLFPIDATGDVAPTHVVSLGAGEGSVWDTQYDEAGNTLYAAGTNGNVLVYENFSETFGADGPTRTLIPSAAGTKTSVNLHGIHYDPTRDTLILSDVGSVTDATDGQIFLVQDVSEASGNVEVSTRIAGDQTRLGNPVDLLLMGDTLYVAEKSNDLLLAYANIFGTTGDINVAATRSTSILKPESLTAGND